MKNTKTPSRRRSAVKLTGTQRKLPSEFKKDGYMSIRHVAFAVQDPGLCAEFCVECLGMIHGPQTKDFVNSGMRWVQGKAKDTHPFKLHFIPNSTRKNCYVDVLNRMRTLVNRNLDVWTQLMDNHICIGYHDATHLVERIVQNKISSRVKRWYADNIKGNPGRVPYIGPVHRKDDVSQFYVMMPFGILVEIQQPKEKLEKVVSQHTTWEELRPAFISGNFENIATRKVEAGIQRVGKDTEFRFTVKD